MKLALMPRFVSLSPPFFTQHCRSRSDFSQPLDDGQCHLIGTWMPLPTFSLLGSVKQLLQRGPAH